MKTQANLRTALVMLGLALGLVGGCGGTGSSGTSAPWNGTSGGTGGQSGVARPDGGQTFASSGGATSSGGAPANAGAGGASAPAPGAGGASNSGDRYVPVGTNPFVATRFDPLSTFGADVDTASYDIFRRDVNRGQLPQPDSVRLEDYVNFFPYEYPAPAHGATAPFEISLGAVRDLFDRHTTLLRVGIQAVKPDAVTKRPANIVFLIDVSGSMGSADKLPLVKRILINALTVLDPTDTVSIVTYASGTNVRLAPTAVSQAPLITNTINALVASGATYGAGGLMVAYQQAQAAFIDGGINHVVLATDGDFNVGPATTADLLALVRSERATGVTLTALGFGVGNLNDQMMEAISNAGDGMYSMISDGDQADSYARDRLLATLVHVAKDVKIQVEFNPALVSAYRLLGYEDRAIADSNFRNDAIDAGEIGEGHRVTALYELVMAGQTLALKAGQPAIQDGLASDLAAEVAPEDMVLVKVRYKGVNATDATPADEVHASLDLAGASHDLKSCDPDVRFVTAVAAFTEILKHSPFADATFLPEISAIVAEQATRDGDRQEFAALFDKAKTLLPATP